MLMMFLGMDYLTYHMTNLHAYHIVFNNQRSHVHASEQWRTQDFFSGWGGFNKFS